MVFEIFDWFFSSVLFFVSGTVSFAVISIFLILNFYENFSRVYFDFDIVIISVALRGIYLVIVVTDRCYLVFVVAFMLIEQPFVREQIDEDGKLVSNCFNRLELGDEVVFRIIVMVKVFIKL